MATIQQSKSRPAGVLRRVLPWRRILVPIGFAREEEIDLIVLTTHGRTGLQHFMMGSTAERVVRHAHCPVYVVRSFGRNQRRGQENDEAI